VAAPGVTEQSRHLDRAGLSLLLWNELGGLAADRGRRRQTLPIVPMQQSRRLRLEPSRLVLVAQRSSLRRHPHTALVSGLEELAPAYPAVEPPGRQAVLAPECWVPARWSYGYTPLTSIEDPNRGFSGGRAG
jgi:hypothetical protein